MQLANALMGIDLYTYCLPAFHPVSALLKAALETEFTNSTDASAFIERVDGTISQMEAAHRVQAWRLLCLTQCNDQPVHPLIKQLEVYPIAVSPTLAEALCVMIGDPNVEDYVRRILSHVPVAVLDHENVARACLRAFDCHRRHTDVALKGPRSASGELANHTPPSRRRSLLDPEAMCVHTYV